MKTGFDDQFIQWSIIKSIICYVGTMIRFLLVMLFLMSKVRVHSFRSCPKPGMVHWRSFVPFSSHQRCFRTATTLHLNRVLVDISECSVVSESGDGDGLLVAELNSTDYRYDHINKILKLQPGQPFRSGIVNVGMTNTAVVLDDISTSQSTLVSATSKKAPTSLRISLGKKADLQIVDKPCISLILAAPRPLRLERILPVVATQGVRHIAIIGAEKVQKDYLGIQLLQRPELMRSLLVEGLEQAEVDYHLPTYSVHKSFHKFINYEISGIDLFADDKNDDGNNPVSSNKPVVQYVRVVTQPQYPTMVSKSPSGEVRTLPPSIRISELFRELFPSESTTSGTHMHPRIRMVIAIGPEGGWTFDELDSFVKRGFRLVHFGDRILRTDTAVQVALGIASEAISQYSIQ